MKERKGKITKEHVGIIRKRKGKQMKIMKKTQNQNPGNHGVGTVFGLKIGGNEFSFCAAEYLFLVSKKT